MSLWYHISGNGYAKARLARHDLGLPVVLCAPGPSMEIVKRQPGIFVAALTKAYPAIVPDLWVGLDTPECYDRRLWHESFTKIARGGEPYMSMQVETGNGAKKFVREAPNTYFAECRDDVTIADIFAKRGHDIMFGWWKHTLGVALQALIWMGARQLLLNGFDLRDVGGRDYAAGVPKQLTKTLRKGNQMIFDQQVAFIKEFARLAERNGIQVISTTLGSPLNAFLPYTPLDWWLDTARKTVPAAGTLFHSREVELMAKLKAAPKVAVAPAGSVFVGETITLIPPIAPELDTTSLISPFLRAQANSPMPLTAAGIKEALHRRKAWLDIRNKAA